MTLRTFTLSLALACVAGASQAQMDHAGMDHAHMHGGQADAATPALPGDDTFGAITEIVTLLQADPDTDWSRVSIEALRLHLLDMDAVVRGPAPALREIDGGVEFVIDTSGPAGDAASRMVPGHAPVLQSETGWTSAATKEGGQLVWRVTATAPTDVLQIRALGYFGLLATGAHHQAHHIAIATGASEGH